MHSDSRCIHQEIVDIVLLSASNVEILAMEERLFEYSAVMAAARANDTSGTWLVRGGKYPRKASWSFSYNLRPFRDLADDMKVTGTTMRYRY